jgi:two-component system invasion response regulator UvrY
MTNTRFVSLLDHPPGSLRVARGGDRTAAAEATLQLVVVDSQAPVREGLPLLLRPEGIEVLGAVSSGSAGEALIAQHEPEVALISLELADGDGLDLVRRLVRGGARSAIVLYTGEEDGAQAARALHAGAAGVIAKRRTISELAAALRVIAGGGLWFNELGDVPPSPEPAVAEPELPRERRTAVLSSAELRVLALVADGRSTEEAADALSLSPHTVRTHLRNVMRKLHASSRAHAVAIAMREAAIDL